MKIDVFTHIIPPKYRDALYKKADPRFFGENWDKVIEGTPALSHMDNRFRVLEKYEGLSQVLTIASPALEESSSPENAVYLAKVANDEIARYDLPIWIHPARARNVPDYRSESHSRFYIYQMFGWPYETTAAMVRLVFSGVFDKFPGIKFITHHCGAMIPYFSERLVVGQDYAETNLQAKWKQALKKPPIDYFRMFYADTALNGNAAALACGYEFFGAEHVVFATDFPYDDQKGERFTREVIKGVESLKI